MSVEKMSEREIQEVLEDNSIEELLFNDDKKLKISTTEQKIKYGLKFAYSNRWVPFEISFDEVDKYDFSNKAFNEFIINQEFVHLYFDFDSIADEQQFLDVITWLDKVSEVFGPYSYGGYCNNEEMEFVGFRRIEGEKHYLSMHVVFYKTKIKSSDLMEIMKHTDKKGFWKHEVHQLCDPNVYKLNSRQAFRHVLSDKIYKENDPQNRSNHGFIINDLQPSTQIVQIRGSEPEIKKEEWIKIFPEIICKTKQAKIEREERKNERGIKNAKIDDLVLDDDLIIFDKDEMQEFLSYFSPDFDNLLKTLAPLRYSPYSKKFLREELIKWYGQIEHTNGVDNVVEQILNYHKKEFNNKWFFSMIKHLPKEIKEQYLAKYTKSIDESMNINSSTFSFNDIKKKKYDIVGFTGLINDLKGVIGVAEDRWFLKKSIDSQFFIQEASDDKMMKKLKNFKPFYGNQNISLAQIVSRYSNYFQYDDAKIMKESQDDIINLFQGFKYEPSESNDFSSLQPFLNHIRHIICQDNEEKYNYLMCWFASIFQKVTVKLGTMPIIYGAQGSGKSFPIEVFSELLGKNALANVDDLDKVFGKFNGLIGRHLFININEPPEATEKFKYTGKIKSKLTQKKTIQETKGVDQIEVDSWANYCMTTNNSNPIQEEKGNRRIIYFETNNEKCGDEKYFDELCKPFQPEQQGEYNKDMMGLLLKYMITQVDISDFKPERLIREINSNTQTSYNEQLERQYQDLNSVDRFVVDNHKLFEIGLALDDIKIEGYKSTGLARKLNGICDVNRITARQYQKLIDANPNIYGFRNVVKNQVRVYKLKPKEQIPDLYAIIEYKKFCENLIEEDEEDENEDDIPIKESV